MSILSEEQWNEIVAQPLPEGTHKAVVYAVEKFGKPLEYKTLLMQAPHKLEDKPLANVAYYASFERQMRDMYSEMPLGRYLRVFFGYDAISDTDLRDLVALHSVGTIEIVDDMEAMVRAVQEGPYSCMKWEEEHDGDEWLYSYEDNDKVPEHPYHAYAPKYGWKMVVRREDGAVKGRCLINGDVFVRSYADCGGSQSYTDQAIEAWLLDKGFKKLNSWPEGLKMAKIPYDHGNSYCNYLIPYIDPGSSTIDAGGHNFRDAGTCFVIDKQGEYSGDCTDGTWEEVENNSVACEDCGDLVDPDDTYGVGRHCDNLVCEHCLEHMYTRVIGRNGAQYYVRDDNAINVGNENYDVDYLSDNEIVETGDGDYIKLDDAVYLEDGGCYEPYEDVGRGRDTEENVVELGDSGDYAYRDYCFWCEHDERWYRDSDGYVSVIDGFVMEQNLEDYVVAQLQDDFDLSEVVYPEQAKDFTLERLFKLDANCISVAQFCAEFWKADGTPKFDVKRMPNRLPVPQIPQDVFYLPPATIPMPKNKHSRISGAIAQLKETYA